MNPTLDHFYLSQPEPVQGCLLALRDMILQMDNKVEETVKYGMPCFTYSKKAFCYLWTDKKTREPYILFVEGQLLDHPDLESGDRKRMKILRIDPNQDLAVDIISSLLQVSIDFLAKKI